MSLGLSSREMPSTGATFRIPLCNSFCIDGLTLQSKAAWSEAIKGQIKADAVRIDGDASLLGCVRQCANKKLFRLPYSVPCATTVSQVVHPCSSSMMKKRFVSQS